jgi:hypothetical protein
VAVSFTAVEQGIFLVIRREALEFVRRKLVIEVKPTRTGQTSILVAPRVVVLINVLVTIVHVLIYHKLASFFVIVQIRLVLLGDFVCRRRSVGLHLLDAIRIAKGVESIFGIARAR